MSIEDWDELLADYDENMEIDLFGKELKDQDLADELDQLVADDRNTKDSDDHARENLE